MYNKAETGSGGIKEEIVAALLEKETLTPEEKQSLIFAYSHIKIILTRDPRDPLAIPDGEIRNKMIERMIEILNKLGLRQSFIDGEIQSINSIRFDWPSQLDTEE